MADLNQTADRFDALARGGLRTALRNMAIGVALTAEGRSKQLATSRMKVRSGRLRNSIAGSVRDTGSGVDIILSAGGRTGGRDVKYAGIQEYGGIVKPHGRFLAIPVHKSLFTRAGVPRFPSALSVPNLRYDDSGHMPVLRQKGTNELFYVLRTRVKIKGKHFLRDGLEEAAKRLPTELRTTVRSVVLHG